jgi:hypothetical protein
METKSRRNKISAERTRELQGVISDLLMLTYCMAIKHLELIAAHHPEELAREFLIAFQPYRFTEMVVDALEGGRRSIAQGLDQRFYEIDERDLYESLCRET